MRTKEQLIAEAARIGIMEGATIRTAWPMNSARTAVVPNPSEWTLHGETDFTFRDKGDDIWIIDLQSSRWATVITPAPAKEEEGLKEGDACECGPAMRAAIKELAKELGLEYTQCHDGAGYIGMAISKNGTIVHAGRIQEQDTTHTPEAFIAKMRITAAKPKPEPPIKISGHTVKFNTGSITVGCTTIPNATVKAIAQKLID